tara:strand:+ start:273 stop:479 length:207 start_codon:yes stop_codon:yes gene_type:complete
MLVEVRTVAKGQVVEFSSFPAGTVRAEVTKTRKNAVTVEVTDRNDVSVFNDGQLYILPADQLVTIVNI